MIETGSNFEKVSENDKYSRQLGKLMSRESTVESVDVEDYMSRLELGEDVLNSNRYMDNLIGLLDEIMKHENLTFNRSLFMHLIEFGGFRKDSLISVRDFFRTYFTVYESMKVNRSFLAEDCTFLTNQIESLKSKLLRMKHEEKVLENGLTNHSKVLLHLKELPINNNLDDKPLPKIQISLDGESTEVELTQDNINKVKKLKVTKLNSHLTVNLVQYDSYENDWDSLFMEKIDIKEILERNSVRDYEIANFGKVSINFIWINSKVNYINYNINDLEQKLLDTQISFGVLDKSMKYLEQPFPKIFTSIPVESHDKKFNTQVSTTSGLFMIQQNEMELTEKIENLIGRVIGQPIIIWENILFFVNRIILLLLIMTFYFRSDYPTLLISIAILAVQLTVLSKNYYYRILFFLCISLLLDSIWFSFYFVNWGVNSNYELTLGRGIRKLSIFSTGLIIIGKLILLFSLWRSYIVYKMRMINPFQKSNKVREIKASKSAFSPKSQKFGRPTVSRKNVNPNDQIFLRYVEFSSEANISV